MNYSPKDILDYIYNNKLDTESLFAITNHVQNFSISEKKEKKIVKRGEDYYLTSKAYSLD